MEQKKTFSENAAFIARAATVPPVTAAILVIVLYLADTDVFRSWLDVAATVFCLSVLPTLAYPLSAVIPRLHARGREGQRDFAFLLSCVGYIAATVYSAAMHRSRGLIFICAIYLFSVLLLLIANKLLNLRASGHACGATGPLLIGVYYFKMLGFIIAALIYALMLWASLRIKRHTAKELFFGTGACVLACVLAWLCVYM